MTDRHGHPLRLAALAADLIAAAVAGGAAYVLRFHVLADTLPVDGRRDVLPLRYLEAVPVVCAAGLAATWAAGLHDRRRLHRAPSAIESARAALVLLALGALLVLLYWKTFQFSRSTLALLAVSFAPALWICRRTALAAAGAILRNPGFRTRTVVIGDGPPLAALAAALARPDAPPTDVVAVLARDRSPWEHARQLDGIEEALALLARGDATEVHVALPAERAGEIAPLLVRLEQTTADVRLVPDFGAAVLLNPGLVLTGGLPLLTVRERPLYGARAGLKRAMDVGIALTMLLALTPVLVLCAIAVAATSRGGVLFAQERMGLDHRSFRMWKFRTMRLGAEDATGPIFATPGDARVTPIGALLRRFSLDELPQLWNVLRGDMSLVGPRPERPPFIEQFRMRFPGYMLRHSVKAGMTGWAQVHGFRGESSLEDRLRYDLEYIQRWTLPLDIEILGRTAVQVIAGRNAC